MSNMEKESFAALCVQQPIGAFFMAFSFALTAQTILFDILSRSLLFDPKYGAAMLVGATAVWGLRVRFKHISEEKTL